MVMNCFDAPKVLQIIHSSHSPSPKSFYGVDKGAAEPSLYTVFTLFSDELRDF